MNWLLLFEIVYIIIVLLVSLRVVYDTRSSVKALAYILFIVFVPFIGIIFYFSFGVNYRKRKLYSKKIVHDEQLRQEIRSRMFSYSDKVFNSGGIGETHHNLAEFVRRSASSPLTSNNAVKLLLNGEEKFPEVLKALEAAQHHIHIEYYIYEDDTTGNSIADVLIKKAREGIEVRFMYDAFGSNSLQRNFIQKLETAGVQTAPFYEIKLLAFANRLNYRNHRKIIVIDGTTSFIGGINISDKYRNDGVGKSELFWRDTHLMLNGPATAFLQYLFLCDWNFASQNSLIYDEIYFPPPTLKKEIGKEIVQLVPSGPDSDLPVILYSLLEVIGAAKNKILITSPYFIPGESLMDTLVIAAQGGLKVQIIVPGISDSKMVNAAARSYYTELLKYGVEVFLYNKGFVHAKTMVVDDNLAIVGSANMDYRSFDLNFEVNALIYGKEIAGQLESAFLKDLEECSQIDVTTWLNRPTYVRLWEKVVRLLSPFL
ncbi:cardiolipin synthase [Pricia sp. S334]|uniref:Cardiolipin synthase n=1 Tax=Pricia mediterranea TaxID=3076079 RepID=A0ABU3L1F6_9FLAO|nr:cardiolipin synthase [Pricia sp. S334]MDT7827546.1 cardiolipin synthase [Pricia sp. S334]